MAVAVERRIESKKDLSPHLLRMMFDEPFFAHILREVNTEFGKQIPTAGVMVKDADVHMLVNPDFISKLSNLHVKGLLKHECFHLALEHCTSRRLEPHGVANIAADLAINSDIPEDELPDGGLVPGQVDKEFAETPLGKLIVKLPKHKSQEFYFTKIMADKGAADQAQGKGEGQKGSGEGEGEGKGSGEGEGEGKGSGKGSGKGEGEGDGQGSGEGSGSGTSKIPGFDNHDGWGEMSDEEKDLVKGKIKKAVEEAVKEADRSGKWGSVGASMRSTLREMVSKEVDWRSLLKQFCGTSRRGTRSTTWNRINTVHIHPKWGPLATAPKRGYTSSIAVYIDQSGSVGNKELELAFAELRNLARRTEFTTFHFDTEVDEKSELLWKRSKTPKASRTRSGGTCFDCVTAHANKNRHRFDGYIVITDGQAAKPKPSKMKRCWLLVPDTKLIFDPAKLDTVCYMKQPKAMAA